MKLRDFVPLWDILGIVLVLAIACALDGCRHPQAKPGTKMCTYWKVDGGNEVQCR